MRTLSLVLVSGLFLATLGETPALGSDLRGGGWRGQWTDTVNNHVGPLRARFRQTADGNYRGVFTGTYYKVVPFVFVAKLKVAERQGDRVILAGESRVPGFGRFVYEGTADANHFNARYNASRWAGEFNMTR